MTRRYLSIGVFVAVLTLSLCGYATVPDVIPIQGYLTDSDGMPIDDTIGITFTLYDAETEGVDLWHETMPVDVDNGFFTVYLGDSDTLNFDSHLAVAEVWLGIAVIGDTEMARIRLYSVPYAVEAQVCGSVGSLTEADINTDFASSVHEHSAGNITSGSLDVERFDAYSDLASRLDENDGADLLTIDQADGRFLNNTEQLNASYVGTGTLNYPHYDAWGDLQHADRLNNDDDSDVLLRSQADGRYLQSARIYRVYTGPVMISALSGLDVTAECSDPDDIPISSSCYHYVASGWITLESHRVMNVTNSSSKAEVQCAYYNSHPSNEWEMFAEIYCLEAP